MLRLYQKNEGNPGIPLGWSRHSFNVDSTVLARATKCIGMRSALFFSGKTYKRLTGSIKEANQFLCRFWDTSSPSMFSLGIFFCSVHTAPGPPPGVCLPEWNEGQRMELKTQRRENAPWTTNNLCLRRSRKRNKK